MTRDNAYKLLGIPTTCTNEEEIKKAFKKLAMKHHPDRGGNEENFKKLLMAKEVLLKPANQNGRNFTQEQYDDLMREYVRKMREDMDRMETAIRGTPRQRKTSKVRTVICGIYLAKVILFMILGISAPWVSLMSLPVFFVFFIFAPQIGDAHEKYLKLKDKWKKRLKSEQ